MKKKAVAILLLALILCSLCSALADSVRPFATPTWVRTGPGLGYKIVDKIYVGNTYSCSSIKVDSRGVAWYKVRYNGKSGWVSSQHAKRLGSSDDPDGYTDHLRIKARRSTTVRAGAGSGYRSLGTLRSGRTATYTGTHKRDSRGTTWYQIRFNGKSGWVSSRDTKKD